MFKILQWLMVTFTWDQTVWQTNSNIFTHIDQFLYFGFNSLYKSKYTAYSWTQTRSNSHSTGLSCEEKIFINVHSWDFETSGVLCEHHLIQWHWTQTSVFAVPQTQKQGDFPAKNCLYTWLLSPWWFLRLTKVEVAILITFLFHSALQ